MLNKIYRLSVDLDHQTYWVDSQKNFELLDEQDSMPGKTKAASTEKESDNFEKVEKYSPRPLPLPRGVAFSGIYLERQDGVVKQGVTHIHFFPNGSNDGFILYLSRSAQEDPYYSLVVTRNLSVSVVPGRVKDLTGAQGPKE